MTALAEQPAGIQHPLFTPPTVVDFQINDAIQAYLQRGMAVIWDTGIGKSALSMATACLALTDGAIDNVIVICEQNKLKEWPEDFATFTRISSVGVYHGPKRARLLSDLPTVLVSSYETFRNDAVKFITRTKYDDGPLIEVYKGRRLLIVYDEIAKLGNRSSKLYKAHYRTMTRVRKLHPGVIVLGLTATPHEASGHENFFNQMRLIAPAAMPTVKDFEDRVVRSRDPWGRPKYDPGGVAWFQGLCAPYISRRRKTDLEVREHFPPFVEQFATAQMHADQLKIYQKLEDLAWDDEGNCRDVAGLAVLLRQLAGDPMALKFAAEHGSSDLAKMVWETLGGQLADCSSAKYELLQERYINPVMASGEKMIIFTFFSNTVLRALDDRIQTEAPVFLYRGEMSAAAKDRELDRFRRTHGPAILLASDSAAKGINAPEASYTVEYEPALKHSTRTQRAGRGHRAFSDVPLTFVTIVLERSVEESRAIPKLLKRNQDQDDFFGDTDAGEFTTAEDRRRMFAMARHRRGA
jgi:superfamily II DNA or RNA helicase